MVNILCKKVKTHFYLDTALKDGDGEELVLCYLVYLITNQVNDLLVQLLLKVINHSFYCQNLPKFS